jgi:hypothetical protein
MVFKPIAVVLGQAVAIVLGSGALAVVTDLVRPDGIPLVTDIPYDIFAPCKDSEVETEEATRAELTAAAATILYVDAQPKEQYEIAHVAGAINVPYSALFGASEADIDKVKVKAAQMGATSVVVYGAFADPSAPEHKIDFGKSLAQQLIEAEIPGVKYVENGLEKLKKTGIEIVQQVGENQK